MNSKFQAVAEILLEHRGPDEGFWLWLAEGKPTSKKDANKFLLGSILDYQILAKRAWENARRLSEAILGDPEDLWHRIASFPQSEWMAKREEYSLHRFPKAHERVWRIGSAIVVHYDGDARRIWEGQPPGVVLDRLNWLRVGEQISRMIVGALIDTGQIEGSVDVKADAHVRRVLGRLLRGRPFTPQEASAAVEATRRMHPENPWLLDRPLYLLGKRVCRAADPRCSSCYARSECTFYSMA